MHEIFFTTLAYETQIYGFLGVAALVFYFISRDKKNKKIFWGRRKALARTTLALIGFAWVVIFYGSFIEPSWITVTRKTIALTHPPKTPITIALIADIHVGPYTKTRFVRRVVERIRALHPDLILIAGDSVTYVARPDDIDYLAPLADLAALIPTYAVLGNHDEGLGDTIITLAPLPEWGAYIEAALTELGIVVLRDDVEPITVRGQELLLVGLKDIPLDFSAPSKILIGEEHDRPWIALGHHPELAIGLLPLGVDLYLTGHTHGGQIRLPFIGPIPELPALLGDAYDQGLKYWGRMPMFITRGLGVSAVRARLFAPPEIALITVE